MMDKKIRIIGIPQDLGQLNRGVNMGPSAIRYAGLADRLRSLGLTVSDSGDIDVPVREHLLETGKDNILPAIETACSKIYDAAKEAMEDGYMPIFLGGDHSISIGTIGGVTHHEPLGVIWIDAHGDFNTPESSKSGNIHGMPLATLLGSGYPELVNLGRAGAKINAKDVVMIGIRDLDVREKEMLIASGIRVFTMRDIDERGISHVTREALAHLSHVKKVHVSLDMDGIDPMTTPGVGTPVPGGLTYREAHLAMETIADSKRLASLDLVEINPMLDHLNTSGEIAVELAVSLFGKSIL